MPIITKNMNVGGAPPTPVKETKPVSVTTFASLRPAIKEPEPAKPVLKQIVEEPKVEEPKYIQKTDGELIRHINKKSPYLRDMLEISS